MPLYDLKCQECGRETAEFIDLRAYSEKGPGRCDCGGEKCRDFSKGAATLDGVSQEGWPRADLTQAQKRMPDGSFRPHMISSRRQQDREYKAKGIERG